MSNSFPRYALCIGINQYPLYDLSTGRPAGASDLRGAVNDALAWAETALLMGIPAKNIAILTSPPVAPANRPASLAEASFNFADRASIIGAIMDLGEALEDGAGGQSLLAWSGHGAAGEDGPTLCPADITGEALHNTISYKELSGLLATRAPSTNLTVILDVCHAAPGVNPASGTHRAIGAGVQVGSAGPRLRDCDLILAAARQNEPAAEGWIQGRYHGWFTWALTGLLSRWGRVTDVTGTYSPLTYEQAAARAGAILAQLEVGQTPVYEGPTLFGEAPLFHPLIADHLFDDEGIPLPVEIKEINPGTMGGIRTYDIFDPPGTNALGWLVVVGNQDHTNNSGTWLKNSEYWKWNAGAFPSTGFSLRIASDGGVPNGSSPGQATRYASVAFAQTPVARPPTGGFTLTATINGSGAAQGWLNVQGATLIWLSSFTSATPPYLPAPSTPGRLVFSSGTAPSGTTSYPVIGPNNPIAQ